MFEEKKHKLLHTMTYKVQKIGEKMERITSLVNEIKDKVFETSQDELVDADREINRLQRKNSN
eukprot:UN28232